MKKKITLSIDEDVYDELGNLPRGVSISEATSWLLRIFLEEIKLGREMTDKELNSFYDRTPGGREFQDRVIKHWGPSLKKIDKIVNSFKGKTERRK